MQRHLNAFVAVFIMHVVNAVQGVDIKLSQPFHHNIVFLHDVIEVQIFRCDGREFRADLNLQLFVHAAVDGV
ncbi:hypothetical protein D3C81_2064890 [compost metagenome]